MTLDVSTFLARFDAMDRALVAAGFPATSPWWRAEIERFLRSGRRRWVLRVGRRGGKSSTLCRLAVCWALWGTWFVPPGDVGIVPFVSVDRDEAAGRIRTIRDVLKALGVEFDEKGDEIALRDRALVFRVATCSVRGTVGFTSVALFADEMARWESRDTAANPAREVMGSLRPSAATQPLAFEVDSSSPWSVDDYHAELFDQGETEHQVTSFAATWTANPTLTEERTHELEPDERVWSREYAAIPGATVSAAFDIDDVEACFRRRLIGTETAGFTIIDASSLRGDTFATIGGRETDTGGIVVLDADGWDGGSLRAVPLEAIVGSIAAYAKRIGAYTIYGDQREEAALRVLFSQRGVRLHTYAWTLESKDRAVMWLRRKMRERLIVLPEHRRLRAELTTMQARLLPSGQTRYMTNGLDYASCLITLAHAALEKRIATGRSVSSPSNDSELEREIAAELFSTFDGFDDEDVDVIRLPLN